MPKVFERPLRATQHCRHYSYAMEPNDKRGPCCAKGVNLEAPGAANVCMPQSMVVTGALCSKREEYTKAERKAWEQYRKESMLRMIAVLAEIPGSSDNNKKDREYWGKQGTIDCPVCEGGKVRWTRAPSNGHLWARCSTPNCFGVMQ